MRTTRIRAYCRHCKHDQEFVRYTPHHAWHLFATIFTIGLWAVSWVAVCIGAWFRPWRCKACGWHQPQLSMHSVPVTPKPTPPRPPSEPGTPTG